MQVSSHSSSEPFYVKYPLATMLSAYWITGIVTLALGIKTDICNPHAGRTDDYDEHRDRSFRTGCTVGFVLGSSLFALVVVTYIIEIASKRFHSSRENYEHLETL